MSVTINDLRAEVAGLNKQYKKTRKTAVRFDVYSAYGRNEIVIKDNMSGGIISTLTRSGSPREVLDELYYKIPYLKKEVRSAHLRSNMYRKKAGK